MAEMAAREGLSHEGYLLALFQVEAVERTERRVQRLMSESRLPRGKTLATFDLDRLPAKARTQVAEERLPVELLGSWGGAGWGLPTRWQGGKSWCRVDALLPVGARLSG
jgi:IstB-like ATP binding protein